MGRGNGRLQRMHGGAKKLSWVALSLKRGLR